MEENCSRGNNRSCSLTSSLRSFSVGCCLGASVDRRRRCRSSRRGYSRQTSPPRVGDIDESCYGRCVERVVSSLSGKGQSSRPDLIASEVDVAREFNMRWYAHETVLGSCEMQRSLRWTSRWMLDLFSCGGLGMEWEALGVVMGAAVCSVVRVVEFGCRIFFNMVGFR